MPLTQLIIRNFRNIEDAGVPLSGRLTLIVGANAQGKTNCLEAVSLILSGVSLRGHHEREMVAHGHKEYRVAGRWQERDGQETRLERLVSIEPLKRRREGPLIPSVAFTPDDLWIIKGAPEARRRFLDELATQISPRYARELKRYQRALAHRNRALKEGAGEAVIGSFEPLLSESGQFIWDMRENLVDQLRLALVMAMDRLAVGEQVQLQFVRGGRALSLSETLMEQLERRRAEEKVRGMTLTGPHRDDLLVMLEGNPADSFASQGQQRTVALGLKLAARGLLEVNTGRRPVVLLDDALSELDVARRQALLGLMAEEEQQTIVTDTESRTFGVLDPLILRVFQGQISPLGGDGAE